MSKSQDFLSRVANGKRKSHSSPLVKLDISGLCDWADGMSGYLSNFKHGYQEQQECIDQLGMQVTDLATNLSRLDTKLMAHFANLSARQDRQEQNVDAQQKYIQKNDDRLEKFSESYLQGTFLRPIARDIVHIIKALHDWLEDSSAIELLENLLLELLAAFQIDLIQPAPGDPFNPTTMKPKTSVRTTHGANLQVKRLVLCGAIYKGTVLCFAEVDLMQPTEESKTSKPQNLNCEMLG